MIWRIRKTIHERQKAPEPVKNSDQSLGSKTLRIRQVFSDSISETVSKIYRSALSQIYARSLNFHVLHPKNLPSSQETDDFHEVGPAGHQIPFGK